MALLMLAQDGRLVMAYISTPINGRRYEEEAHDGDRST